MPERSLGKILRQIHEQNKTERDAELAKRSETDAELVDEATGRPLQPIGDYDGDPELDKLSVRIRLLPKAHFMRWLEESADGETMSATLERMRTLVRMAVPHVAGFVDENGEAFAMGSPDADGLLDAAELDALDGAGLIPPLFQAARYLQLLPGNDARRCGLPAPSI